jgi:hypothetical protein
MELVKIVVTDTITVTVTIIKSNQKEPWYKKELVNHK